MLAGIGFEAALMEVSSLYAETRAEVRLADA